MAAIMSPGANSGNDLPMSESRRPELSLEICRHRVVATFGQTTGEVIVAMRLDMMRLFIVASVPAPAGRYYGGISRA